MGRIGATLHNIDCYFCEPIDAESIEDFNYITLSINKNLVFEDMINYVVYFDLSLITDPIFWDRVASDGGDLRASNLFGTLQYSIDLFKFNKSLQIGEIHIRIPFVSSSVDTKIRLWFNSARSIQALSDPFSAYACFSGYHRVQHMSHTLTSPSNILEPDRSGVIPGSSVELRDSTTIEAISLDNSPMGEAWFSESGGASTAGRIDLIPGDDGFWPNSTVVQMEWWMRWDDEGDTFVDLLRIENSQQILGYLTGTQEFRLIYNDTDTGQVERMDIPFIYTPSPYNYVVIMRDLDTGVGRCNINGVEVAGITFELGPVNTFRDIPAPAGLNIYEFGGQRNTAGVDEFRLRGTIDSANVIKSRYENFTNVSSFVKIGAVSTGDDDFLI